MKKVLMLAAMVLGTAAMVNVQAAPAKTVPAKEVKVEKQGKHAKHAKHAKSKVTKAEPAKMGVGKAKK
jgi:hypothetical protein